MTPRTNQHPKVRSESQRSMKAHAIFGFGVIFCLLGGLCSWAATTSIAGAIIAHGQVVVSSNTKKIQHPTGGVVKEIWVRNGSVVREGEVLLSLDETVIGANLAMVSKGLTELTLLRARLIAERDGAHQITFPAKASLVAEIADNAMFGENALFEMRRAARKSVKAQLQQRIQQTGDELTGLQAQLDAKAQEITFIGTELTGARELWQKSLMPITKYTALQREAARLKGEHGQLIASIAQARGKITETELKILQIGQDLSSETGKELREAESRINEFVERKVTAEDQLERTRITAPQAGIVHELAAHTIGGVIRPGDDIMLIVPQHVPLIVEVKIQPQDIDQIQIGQSVLLRFSAFNQSATPDCLGTLRHVSADLTSDPRTGVVFYVARVDVKHERMNGFGNVRLLPGMPMEAFIHTGERTVLSYFVKPLADQIARAFRDG
jgi:HlyD family secretion protein